jgi:hypothetical protein
MRGGAADTDGREIEAQTQLMEDQTPNFSSILDARLWVVDVPWDIMSDAASDPPSNVFSLALVAACSDNEALKRASVCYGVKAFNVRPAAAIDMFNGIDFVSLRNWQSTVSRRYQGTLGSFLSLRGLSLHEMLALAESHPDGGVVCEEDGRLTMIKEAPGWNQRQPS